MCSQTLAQEYQTSGNNVLQRPANSQPQHLAAMNAANGTANGLAGEPNIHVYMEPYSIAPNYLTLNGPNGTEGRNDHHYCQTGVVNGGIRPVMAEGSVPSSPLSTLSPPTSPTSNPPSLPPYLSDSLSSNRHLTTSHNHQHSSHQSPNDQQIPQPYFHDHIAHSAQEFLPLCDLLFNIISLAAYFCDIVFDSVTAYTLYLQRDTLWLSVCLSLILLSLLISQVLSYRWYYRKMKGKESLSGGDCQSYCVLTLHALMCGVLWRYFKLFIPVDLSSVKHEVRDLCVLRMIHAFCEAAPMLGIQVYLLWLKPSADQITDLNIISIFLSLFSLCWALASFSKNVRSHNIHKLVLTWLGVIFQFFWRLGTISSRVVALTAYATIYSYWVFAVIILHWFSMLLWLLTPKNLFYGEKISSLKRLSYSCLIAWVYLFCFINMQEENSKNRLIAFYSTMFLENILLMSICLMMNSTSNILSNQMLIAIVLGGFGVGMFFMILYYKFFHIRHLKHTLLATQYDQIDYSSNRCPEHGSRLNGNLVANGHNRLSNGWSNDRKLEAPLMNSTPNGVISGIPGVFNCRLNPALKRKKKKPSTFIPPPVPHISANASNAANTSVSPTNNLGIHSKNGPKTSKAPPIPTPTAFWKKYETGSVNGFKLRSQSITPAMASSPLTLPAKHPFSASIAPSPVANFTTDLQLIAPNIAAPVSSRQVMTPNIPSNPTPVPTQRQSLMANNRKTPDQLTPNAQMKVNIQQKLKEKKQQQFMQLMKIEEEIKQGIISKPQVVSRIASPPLIHSLAAPQAKKQPVVSNGSNQTSNAPFVPLGNRGIHHYYYHPVYRRVKLRSQTPEVLLAPHYLDNSRVFYDYPSCVLPPIQLLKPPLENAVVEEEEEKEIDNNVMRVKTNKRQTVIERKRNAKNKEMKLNNNSSNRLASDIDSQVSLPRSYTLPREFQYCRAGQSAFINDVMDQNNYLKSSRLRKQLSTEHFHNPDSESSNDGDVDTDINPDDYEFSGVPKIIRGPVNNMRAPAIGCRSLRDYGQSRYKRHETPL